MPNHLTNRPHGKESMSEILLKGRYRNLSEIGRGERTVAYKALDTSLDRTVVIKVLRERYAADPDFVERFQRAARAMAGLSHANIVSIHDIGRDRDLCYMVSEYVEGENLESLLISEAPLGQEMVLDIAAPLCEGLGAAHRAGYIHGRLTPRNVLLTTDGQVKISDFDVEETLHPIPAGDVSRSPYSALYLSPEQLMGRRATPASDVYSVGVILYEMLSGHPPFHGESFTEVAEGHLRQEPEPLSTANPQIPDSLSALVHKALAKTSSGRYRTAGDLAEALDQYSHGTAREELVDQIGEEAPVGRLADVQPGTAAGPWGLDAGPEVAHPEEGRRFGVDWVGCSMGVAAIVALLGLIPLWLAVYLRYLG